MTAEPRARLAARQAELITALYGGPPAHGLDPRMVTLTSVALARKRARAVAMTWPALVRGLGADFAPLFTAYARATPPPEGGVLADGLAFSRTLAREQHLPDDALIERMLAATRVKLRHNRVAARRGLRLAAAITAPPRRLVIIISLPPIGAHFLILSPPGRRAISQPARDGSAAH